MRNETSTRRRNSQPLNISLGPFARDKRLDRIEHILELLMESRSGYGGYYQRLEMPGSMALVDFVNYDLMPVGIDSFLAEEWGRDIRSFGDRVSEIDITLRLMTFSALFHCQARGLSPPARGSPVHHRPNIRL